MARFIASRTLTAALSILVVALDRVLLHARSGGPACYLHGQHPLLRFLSTSHLTFGRHWEKFSTWISRFQSDSSIGLRICSEANWDGTGMTWRAVSVHLRERAAPTLKLALSAWTFAAVVGVSLGALSALSRASALGRVNRWLYLTVQAAPPFLVGLIGLALFAVQLRWFPTGTMGEGFQIQYYALPVIALASLPAIAYMRFTRLAALGAMDSRLVSRARARGVGYGAIMRRYAMRSVLASSLAVTSQSLPWFATGLVVVEFLFGWQGLGEYLFQGYWYDRIDPAVAVLLIGAIALSGAKLILDILRRLVDPKSQYAW